MSPETNKAIVRQMLERVWNERRMDLVAEFYTEDVVQHLAGDTFKSGFENVRKTASMLLNAYPDLQIAILDEIAEGDKVVNRWTMTGKSPGGSKGIPASEQQVLLSGITIFHLSNARIDEFWLLADHLKVIQQLGGVPTDAA